MTDFQYQSQKISIWMRIRIFLEEIWPTVYRIINEFFWGVIRFFKFLVQGFKPF